MKTEIEITRDMNPLQKHVAEWINKRSEDYEDGVDGVYNDLMYGGCQSGYVGGLIYYKDTHAFYQQYSSEIEDILYEMEQDLGESPLIHKPAGDDLQNWLAWFGFEETARQLMEG